MPPPPDDSQKRVIFLKGSFQKGYPHGRSDLDFFSLQMAEPLGQETALTYLNSFERKLREIVEKPEYFDVKRILSIYGALEKKLDAKTNHLDREIRRNLRGKRVSLHPAIAERAMRVGIGPKFYTTKSTDFSPILFDFDYHESTLTSILTGIYVELLPEKLPIDQLILIFTSTADQVYEVTPGSLRFYQKFIINSLTKLKDEDLESFNFVWSRLEAVWVRYFNRVPTSDKETNYPLYFRELKKNYGADDGLKSMPTLPSLDELKRIVLGGEEDLI